MRLRAAWSIPWLLAVLLSVLLTQESAAQDDNLLINGGFEDGTEGWLAVAGQLRVDDSFVHGGSYAGVFVADDTFSRHEVSYCLPVAPSTDYEFGGYTASHDGDIEARLRLDISWYGQGDCFGGEVGGGPDESGVELREPERWYELEVWAKSPPNARGARLRIVVEESEATVYLDDFAVSGPAAPTETPTAEPSASATPTATPRPPIPSPSATPHISPTASSWQMTPVPVEGALRNGGFEEADSEGRPSSWKKYGGELARTNAVRLEGRFAAALSSQTSSTKWAYQIVAVQAGSAYVLSGYALKADPAVAAAYLRLSWYASRDGSGQAIDSADSTAVLVDDSPEFRFLTTGAVVAPADAASAKARLMLDPVGETPGTVYFDAATFEETALPEPTLSPTATPFPGDDEQTPAAPLPTLTASPVTPTPERRAVPTPAGGVATPRPSPTGAGGGGNRATAALGAARTPVATVTTGAAATSTRVPASVYRQRKSDSLAGGGATAREDNVGGGLSPQLLALAVAVPALAGAGAGVYYWRWRRARLR